MSESIDVNHLNSLKQAHDQYATTIHLLKTRSPYYFDEFQGIIDQVGFYSALKDQVLAKIQEIEPPASKEPKKPYVIDVPINTESSGHAEL